LNLALSEEQRLLREAARGTLSRVPTVAAARAALDGEPTPDLWPAAREAGWPGLLIAEQRGGAGLGAFDAMLVMEESGRVLADPLLLGHLPASGLLDAAAGAQTPALEALATGEQRAAYLPVRPPDDVQAQWSVDPHEGLRRGGAPSLSGRGTEARVSGRLSWVPGAPGADLLVGVAIDADGKPAAIAVEGAARGASVKPVMRYDATRSLGHVELTDAPATVLDAPAGEAAAAWFLAQALLAAESVGAVQTALDVSVAYAQERHTFGRPIGSYQAIKHGLTEVLRRLENARSLLYYAAWARQDAPDEFPLAASAARSAAGRALDFAAREMISVHGGIGATWEHDAPLYFRRAQLSRRLIGGTADASERVAAAMLARADASGSQPPADEQAGTGEAHPAEAAQTV